MNDANTNSFAWYEGQARMRIAITIMELAIGGLLLIGFAAYAFDGARLMAEAAF